MVWFSLCLKDYALIGINLPGATSQQLTLQYADDTSFFVRAKEQVKTLIDILDTFALASGLVINWAKSSDYWVSKHDPRLAWTNAYDWVWVWDGHIAKLLGILFGLSISTPDIDNLLKGKI